MKIRFNYHKKTIEYFKNGLLIGKFELNLVNFKNAHQKIEKGYLTSGIDIFGEWVEIKSEENHGI